MSEVTRLPAGGYTLVFPSILAVTNPALMRDYSLDTLRDFAPLTVVGFIPHARGFDVHGWYGLLLKAGTPPQVMDRRYAEVKGALDTQEVGEVFRAQDIEPGGMTPAEFTMLVREDLAMWKRTIVQLDITLQ
ncbi:tripartite tricarboxylate transporter substrate-binding protein [Variovorax humicola]|uniref:Tripartite tricarboxylate transporter substrate-binding protein n=1 Tax=Variovorax humicola TaxID=1769758 RepID=A0ABU8W186_9BURK